MASPAILALRIVSDAAQAIGGFRDTETAAQKWSRRVTTASTVASAGLVAVARASIDAASAQQQSFGAVESVYGDAADQVKELANSAADSVGLAASEYAQFAAVLGSQLGNLGVAQEDLIGTQDDLIRTASDLAATFGGTTAEAVEALSSLFRGETDPIERYGVSINEAAVSARLAEQGLSGLEGQARASAETQARLALLTEQTTAAQGAFAREADTAAGAQQRANAAWQNSSAQLGQALLPIVTQVTQGLTILAQWVGENTGVAKALAAAVVTLTVGMRVLNAVIAANPIGLIIVAITTLISLVVIAYNESETFRNVVKTAGRIAAEAFSAIIAPIRTVIGWIGDLVAWAGDTVPGAVGDARDAAVNAFGAFIAPISAVIDWIADLADKLGLGSALANAVNTIRVVFDGAFSIIRGIVNGVRGAIDSVRSAIQGAIDAISVLNRAQISPLDMLFPWSRGGALALSGASVARTEPTMIVNVTGALDPDAVAAQIETILTNRRSRLGQLNAFA